jgi:hypothetical protein
VRRILLVVLGLLPGAALATPILVPPGYVRQQLEPTGGEVARPIEWYFHATQTPSGWIWTMSKEDSRNGSYLTGQRIQLMVGVEASSGLTRAGFVDAYLADRRRGGRVLTECPATDQGAFHRRCLEVVQEGEVDGKPRSFRIMHSLMWGKDLDMVVSSTFGAPSETWRQDALRSAPMADFSLLGADTEKLAAASSHIQSLARPEPGPVGVIINVTDGSEQGEVRDAAFKNALGYRFQFRDVRTDDKRLVRAKPLAGSLPPAAFTNAGERIAGEATVAYVISREGLAIEPRIVKMDDPRLETTVLAAVRAWRFEPATLSGKSVASLASQQFAFDLADPED